MVTSSFQLSNGGGVAFSSANNVTFGQITASNITVTNLYVQYVSSSIDYTSGSVFINGSLTVSGSTNLISPTGQTVLSTNADVIEFTGSLFASASMIVTGSVSIQGGLTDSLHGTSRWAVTASYALS
jgi:hypothetical protein